MLSVFFVLKCTYKVLIHFVGTLKTKIILRVILMKTKIKTKKIIKINKRLRTKLIDFIDIKDYRNNQFMKYEDYTKISSYKNYNAFMVKTIINHLDFNYKTDHITKKLFIDKLDEILNYGLDSGSIGSLIYNSDLFDVYNQHEKEINQVITDHYNELGYKDLLSFISENTYLKKHFDDIDDLKLCFTKMSFEILVSNLMNVLNPNY
jgi:hypothetical protein